MPMRRVERGRPQADRFKGRSQTVLRYQRPMTCLRTNIASRRQARGRLLPAGYDWGRGTRQCSRAIEPPR